ncbi:MAG: metal-dependent hydrolase [Clostridia bacterium]|nr:metal-dependent hydrolase [Clostridia bacterium]
MDPITHAVIGITVAKATGHELQVSDAQTMALIVGAVFPDIDILFQKWGDGVYLKNHRGITHSLVGLAASSVFLAFVLGMAYPGSHWFTLFLWTFVGCLTHSFFDIFNSYGAKLLWPFIKSRFTFGLLIVFDPVFIGTLLGYILSNGSWKYFYLYAFLTYILLRLLTRLWVVIQLNRVFGSIYRRISVYPSLSGFFRWHFVLEGEDINLIGEKNIMTGSIKVVRKLYKLQEDLLDKVLESPVGEFFAEFTPLVHVDFEDIEGGKRYTFIDMRYYIRNNFLHHAILEVDENDLIIKASFNPYSIHRNSSIPV